MEQKHIDFNYRANYSILGTPGQQTKQIWFVLHGYGQLAKYFLRKFAFLDDGHHIIVAPEGLSRFYLDGFSGKVGATWMTKEERETDIRNYITYLNKLGKEIIKQSEALNASITVLGFSQGAATASRWIADAEINIERFILWAGIFPEDLNLKKASEKLAKTNNYLVVGAKDEFLTEKRREEQMLICKKLNIKPEIISFEGGHDINQEVLRSFV